MLPSAVCVAIVIPVSFDVIAAACKSFFSISRNFPPSTAVLINPGLINVPSIPSLNSFIHLSARTSTEISYVSRGNIFSLAYCPVLVTIWRPERSAQILNNSTSLPTYFGVHSTKVLTPNSLTSCR